MRECYGVHMASCFAVRECKRFYIIIASIKLDRNRSEILKKYKNVSVIFSVQNRGSQTQDTGQLARKPHTIIKSIFSQIKKQPTRAELKKRCSENMQQIYRRTPMPKCEIARRHGVLPQFAAYFQNTFS